MGGPGSGCGALGSGTDAGNAGEARWLLDVSALGPAVRQMALARRQLWGPSNSVCSRHCRAAGGCQVPGRCSRPLTLAQEHRAPRRRPRRRRLPPCMCLMLRRGLKRALHASPGGQNTSRTGRGRVLAGHTAPPVLRLHVLLRLLQVLGQRGLRQRAVQVAPGQHCRCKGGGGQGMGAMASLSAPRPCQACRTGPTQCSAPRPANPAVPRGAAHTPAACAGTEAACGAEERRT